MGEPVNPARAGMIADSKTQSVTESGKPRASGDDRAVQQIADAIR